MKVAVFGNRKFTDADRVCGEFWELVKDVVEPIVLLHGGADGPQKFVFERFMFEYEVVRFSPWHMVWNKIPFSPVLFFMRNKQILDNLGGSDLAIIFDNGEYDTESTRVIEYCVEHGINHEVVNV